MTDTDTQRFDKAEQMRNVSLWLRELSVRAYNEGRLVKAILIQDLAIRVAKKSISIL